LLRRADIALYRAKAEGKNGYQLFTPDMDEVVQSRRLLEVDLAQALAKGDQLHLAYQPLYSGINGEITGVEALARWEHPTKRNLPPSLFIPVAEASGLIVPMGEWILRTACRQAVEWNIGYVAVNVSPIQFRQPGFATSVKRILSDTGLHPSRLELEITEGVLVDKEKSGAVLASLRDAGIKIAIDDFGTGYSSLSYLRQLDVDKIKIDQSFIRQADNDEGGRSIVLAMVQLAGALRMQVTAEGVETHDQRAYLSSIGCDQLQGYLLSRPLTPNAMEEKLNGTMGVLAA
jgi:EAL domain-containing protein (putative c-di-GMP-specific phosphodiesterase class I)